MQREPWQIEILGGLSICRAGQPPVEVARQQTGTLLAYLALRLNHSHSREELMAAVWPEDTPEAARRKLRQSLHALRHLMDSRPDETDSVLQTTRTAVQLNPRLVTTDAVQFEKALQTAVRTADISPRIDLLTKALDLYRGELLPGFYQEALLNERSRLAGMYRSALQQLTLAYQSAGDLNHAIETARRTLALDPLMEEAHCDLMSLYAAAGQPSAVLRQCQELVRRLKEELGEEPLEATRQMMESLRRTAQSNAASHRNAAASTVPIVSKEEITPVVSEEFQPVSAPGASVQTSRKWRRWLQPLLAFGGAALCLLLLQALGRRVAVSANPVPSTSFAARPSVDPMPTHAAGSMPAPAERSKGAPAPVRVQPRPRLPAKGATVAHSVSKPAPPSRAAIHVTPSAPGAHLAHAASTPESRAHSNSPEPDVKQPPITEPDNPDSVVPVEQVAWMRRYEPRDGDKTSEATAVTSDRKGNIYVAGFVDTVDHDVDFLTIKYDSDGHRLWERRYDGPSHDMDRARAIAVDNQGCVYVTGESDNGKGKGPGRFAGTDFATIKYGPDGKPSPTWPDIGFGVGVRRYNGPDDGEDRPDRLLVDESGVYVLGRSWGRGKTGKGGFNIALVKYDRYGKEVLKFRYDGGHGDDVPADMAIDPDGSIYVTGQSRSEPPSGPEFDMVTLKISKDGKQILWKQPYGASNCADDRAVAIGLDGGGNVIVVGEGRGASGTPDAARTGCIMVKYDPFGKLQWARGTVEERDRIETVITARISVDGEVIVAGTARDARAAPVIRTVARDSKGLPRWIRDLRQNGGNDGPSAVDIDPKGTLLCGALWRSDHGLSWFAVRYNDNGKSVWQHYLGAEEGQSFAEAIISRECSPIVVGQANDGKNPQLVVIKYRD